MVCRTTFQKGKVMSLSLFIRAEKSTGPYHVVNKIEEADIHDKSEDTLYSHADIDCAMAFLQGYLDQHDATDTTVEVYINYGHHGHLAREFGATRISSHEYRFGKDSRSTVLENLDAIIAHCLKITPPGSFKAVIYFLDSGCYWFDKRNDEAMSVYQSVRDL